MRCGCFSLRVRLRSASATKRLVPEKRVVFDASRNTYELMRQELDFLPNMTHRFADIQCGDRALGEIGLVSLCECGQAGARRICDQFTTVGEIDGYEISRSIVFQLANSSSIR